MKNQVVIVIPIYKEALSEYERVSLKQCVEVLKRYSIVFVCPHGLDVHTYKEILTTDSQCSFAYFNETYFTNTDTYNKLLLSIKFYESFKSFEYILIHQLDAYVFRDELEEWCSKGYDYIGAPWVEYQSNKKINFVGVGNGGLSLRKVKSFLRVLNSFSYLDRIGYIYYLFVSKPFTVKTLVNFIKKLTIQNNTFHKFNDYKYNEDVFWGIVANRNFEWFTVPTSEVALKFSIEEAPSNFIEDEESLPFGCHAWWKYDLPLWKKYINIPKSYEIEEPK